MACCIFACPILLQIQRQKELVVLAHELSNLRANFIDDADPPELAVG